MTMAKETDIGPVLQPIAPEIDQIPGYTQVKETAQQWLNIGKDYEWMAEVATILLLATVFSLLARQFLRLLAKLVTRANSALGDVFVKAMRSPLKAAIWILAAFYASESITVGLYGKKQELLMDGLADGRNIALVLIIAWAANRYINGGFKYYKHLQTRRGKPFDVTALTALSKLLKIVVGFCAFLLVLQNLGVSLAGVVAAGGIGGIAIGFAAKDMLANFFGAFIIYFDKPFKVGDWIRSPDREIEGTVEEIGWRITTIRTLDKRPLYVPNSLFSSIAVENPSRMSHRRIRETIGIRYDDLAVMEQITSEVRAMLEQHAEIDKKETIVVNFTAFNTSSCDFLLSCFTRITDMAPFHVVKQDVLLKVAEIIARHGAEIAYPTQVGYVLSQTTAPAQMP